MAKTFPIYCAGEFITTTKSLNVTSPYSGEVGATTYLATKEHLERAIHSGLAVQEAMQTLPTHTRADALLHIAQRLTENKELVAQALTLETAKPLFFSRIEVDRAVQTFLDGAEESKRIYGEWMALDRTVAGNNHEAIVRRFPVGLVAAIAPFNFPLNLVAHKLAPAIAAGCPIVLKPATKTPLSALYLAEYINETNLPKGAVSILPMDRDTGDLLVTDDRFKLLTFTGSPSVGWDMKGRAGRKKVVLELGGNAAVIVTPTGNITKHIKKIALGAFGQSGQSCIHIQRIYVHKDVKQSFLQSFIAEVGNFTYGDPTKDGVMFSSMIDAKNAERIAEWVNEAVAQGATILHGGKRIAETGFEPTILTNTTNTMKVCAEEAFAPIVIVEEYSDFKEVVRTVNDSAFGLQAGVFSNELSEIMYAYEHLEVGGVVVNNGSNFRGDNMPYGGVKDSGIGREGVRYAIEDMTERRVLVINKDF